MMKGRRNKYILYENLIVYGKVHFSVSMINIVNKIKKNKFEKMFI